MDKLIVLYYCLAVALGVGRWADLAFWTDTYTGLAVSGSVWLRYAALAAVVLLGVVTGRKNASKPQRLRACIPLAAVIAMVAAVCFALAAVSGVLLAHEELGVGVAVRAALEVLCAVWLVCVGLAWRGKGEWHAPTPSMLWAVLGSALFYWRVLACFMENSSSWHRVTATATVWQMVAALVFLAALARALYLPDAADGKTLAASALAAFELCFCWELPRLAVMGNRLDMPDVLFGAGLCAVGLLGGVCAAVSLRRGRSNT